MARGSTTTAATLLYAAAYGYALWFVVLFHPGNLSLDSFEQYEQALSGVINDHHPPVMAACLRLFMDVGLGLRTLMATQVLAGVVGVHLLTAASARALSRHRAESDGLAGAIAFALLVSPLSPLLFYLTTFWKDSWFSIALVWGIVSTWWLLVPDLTKAPRWLTTVLLLGSASAMVLSRHNGLALLPVLAVALIVQRETARRWFGLAVAAAATVLALGLSQTIYAAFDVERRYVHENYVMFYDLVALCEATGEGEDCAARLIADAAAEDASEFQRRRPELWAEWTRAVLAHPFALALVKLDLFGGTLNLTQGPHDYVLDRIYGEFKKYGLTRDPAGDDARAALSAFTNGAARLPVLRFVLGSHVLWFAISLVATLWIALRSWRARSLDARFAVFALPLTYYLSYLPVFTTGDFRYMYPATLAVQVVTVAGATAAVARALASRAGPARAQ